jgi:hypothetical protein
VCHVKCVSVNYRSERQELHTRREKHSACTCALRCATQTSQRYPLRPASPNVTNGVGKRANHTMSKLGIRTTAAMYALALASTAFAPCTKITHRKFRTANLRIRNCLCFMLNTSAHHWQRNVAHLWLKDKARPTREVLAQAGTLTVLRGRGMYCAASGASSPPLLSTYSSDMRVNGLTDQGSEHNQKHELSSWGMLAYHIHLP